MNTTTCQTGSTIMQRVRSLYEQAGLDFDADLLKYLNEGYVHYTPTYFIMGKQVGDGWFVQCCVSQEGPDFTKLIPYPLPYIGFYRHSDGKVRWYKTEKIITKLTYAKSRITSSPTGAAKHESGGGGHSNTEPGKSQEACGLRPDDPGKQCRASKEQLESEDLTRVIIHYANR
jgi:hypothetical protein